MKSVLTLDDARLSGLTVLVRVDINSPLHPETQTFMDDSRLRAILPTLRRLADSKVVLLAHQSRPGKADFTDMSFHADLLSRLLGRHITFVPDVCGEIAIEAIRTMEQGQMILLDNVRGWSEENNLTNVGINELQESKIVQNLSSVADAYVTDAFAAAHRNSPTLSGFAKLLPCFAGELMAAEIHALSTAVEDPPKPYVAILGGAKCDDSLRIAKNLLNQNIADTIVPVGVVGNLMLWAAGHSIGEGNEKFIRSSLGESFESTFEDATRCLQEHSDRLILPSDLAIEVDGRRVAISIEELPTKYPIYDVGISTLQSIHKILREAECILWNGPASYFELEEFAFGTIEILNMICESDAFSIIGGGHTSALVSQRKLVHLVNHNSTGGGACLTMLAGDSMPVIESLLISAEIYRDKLE
tara:strand:- start:769 stop:2016 length:1248 start_codon:yes stop_codon:yes gene_type:complete